VPEKEYFVDNANPIRNRMGFGEIAEGAEENLQKNNEIDNIADDRRGRGKAVAFIDERK
jgi:hypothetical protein